MKFIISEEFQIEQSRMIYKKIQKMPRHFLAANLLEAFSNGLVDRTEIMGDRIHMVEKLYDIAEKIFYENFEDPNQCLDIEDILLPWTLCEKYTDSQINQAFLYSKDEKYWECKLNT